MDQPPPHHDEFPADGVFIAIDVAHVGALWTRDPDQSWEALNQLDELIETMLEDWGGVYVNVAGEAYVARFDAVGPAVMWCARMQEGLLTLDWPATLAANFDASGAPDMLFGGLLARMAIHRGDIDMLQSLVALCSPGQVLISGETWAEATADPPPDLQVAKLGHTQIGASRLEILQVSTRLLSRRRFASLATHSSRLPAQSDCFVGRLSALSDLQERFEAGTRLVNITGAKGSGKTRLAIQWARGLEASGAYELAWVSLGAAQDETDLHLATASALSLSLGPAKTGTLAERVGHAMAAKGPVVLILDDFNEDLGVDVLATWLRTAPQARFVITTDSPIDSQLATHQHLKPRNQRDIRAIYLARQHRKLRASERPTHASAIAVPSPLSEACIAEIEVSSSEKWAHQQPCGGALIATRRRVSDPKTSFEDRVAAIPDCVAELGAMGMHEVALALLDGVDALGYNKAETDPTLFAKLNTTRADVLISAGEWTKAHALIDAAEADNPDWLLRRAWLALAESRHGDAVEILEGFASTNDRPDIALAYGLALAGSDEWEAAIEPLERAANGSKQGIAQAKAWSALGGVFGGLGRAQESTSALEAALGLGRDDPHVVASIHQHRFEAAIARLDLDKAAAHIADVTLTLTHCGDRAGTAKSLIHGGILALVRHDPEGAKTLMDSAQEIGRQDGLALLEAEALLGQGITARMTGDLISALDAFAEALSLTGSDHGLAALIFAHRGATEAACDAIDNAVADFERSNEQLEQVWDVLGTTVVDVLYGFVDLAKARDAALGDNSDDIDHHVDMALNRLARGSSFETRSTPPRGRERPNRINELRLARLLLDNALSTTTHPRGKE
jgi:tetratricopeptide (TPR) repeat protein